MFEGHSNQNTSKFVLLTIRLEPKMFYMHLPKIQMVDFPIFADHNRQFY